MARLNIEEKFFASPNKVKKMARLRGCSKNECTGTLVYFWHNSQSEMAIEGDAEQICDWAEVYDDCDNFIEAMCHKSVGFLTEIEGTNPVRYRINGNEKQVENIKKYKERASKGGKKKAANQKAVKDKSLESKEPPLLEADFKQTTSVLEADLERTCSLPIQYNTITNTNKDNKLSLHTNARAREEGVCEVDKNDSISLEQLEPTTEEPPKKKTKTSKKKALTQTWEPDNPLSKVFSRLMEIKPYRAILDVPKDTTNLTRYMKDYDLSLSELYQIVVDFHNWCDTKGVVKSPRGTLVTFISKFAEKRNKKSHATSKYQKPNRPKVESFGYESTDPRRNLKW